MFLVFALTDPANMPRADFVPLALFFAIFGIGACFGWETGYAINFARDLGPRLMSYCLGYGNDVFSAGNYYFWVSGCRPSISRGLRVCSLTDLGPAGCLLSRLRLRRVPV
jgi:aquaglyceroporin related protein